MKAVLPFIFCILLFTPKIAYACFCVSPGIKAEYQRADIVFIGRLIDTSKIALYMPEKYPEPLPMFTFEIIKTSKGLRENESRLSVLDFYHATSCGGLFHDKKIGDTILVFAEKIELSPGLTLALSSNCIGNLEINNFSLHDSLEIITSLPWNEVEPEEKIQVTGSFVADAEHEKERNNVLPLLLALLAGMLLLSVILNLAQFFRNRSRSHF